MNKHYRWALYALLIAFTLLSGAYSVTVPLFEMSDELWHYPMVEVLARTWEIPVQPLEPGAPVGPWRQEASQPPLYYALGAALTAWIDTSDLPTVRHLNPHTAAGVIMPDGSNANLAVHNPAIERFPWRGTVLAVHLVRLFSVLLGTWAVYLTWALVRELYPAAPWLALAAAAIHAFTPMVVFIHASVNNDNLIVPLCSLALLQMVRLVKGATRFRKSVAPQTPYLWLGLTIGLAMLTKASGLALLPLAAATVAWQAKQRLDAIGDWGRTLLHAVREMTLVLLPALAVSGWWFYRNFQLYGDWLGLNAFYAVLGTRDVPADLAQLWAERFAFAAGYWGNFGGLNVPLPAWAYTLLNICAIVALAGGGFRLLLWLTTTPLRRINPWGWDTPTAARALAWAWPAGVFISWIRWATETWSSQGRLIFSALPMWSLLLALGLTAWVFDPPDTPSTPALLVQVKRRVREQARQGIALTFAALLCALSVIALPAIILPAYAAPLRLTPEAQAATRLTTPFGAALQLLDYHIATQTATPGEPISLTLTWQALAPTPSDHSIFVHVYGAGERIIAQRDSFPGRGLLSTTWLEPGYTWQETYIIAIPPMAYAPDELTVRVGVYETATGARLTVPNGDEWVELGQAITLAPRRDPLPVRFDKGMGLSGYELSAVRVAPGETLTVTLHWDAQASIGADYTVSVQLLDTHWNKAAQADTWPPIATSAWVRGQHVEDIRALAIAAEAVPGVYDLRLAVYRQDESGQLLHLPVVWEPGQMPSEAIVLTRVRIE